MRFLMALIRGLVAGFVGAIAVERAFRQIGRMLPPERFGLTPAQRDYLVAREWQLRECGFVIGEGSSGSDEARR